MNTSLQYSTGEERRNSSRRNEEVEPKRKKYTVVDVSGSESEVWYCKEQYCKGTWNVRSMNQGKLEVVKRTMTRVNIDILGNSKLKWTKTGEFNSDDHYTYYCGQESLRRNGVVLIVNKIVKHDMSEYWYFRNQWTKMDWNAKVESQEIPGETDKFGLGTKWCKAKTNRVLPRKHTAYRKHHPLTIQKITLHIDNSRWSISKADSLYYLQAKMENIYTVHKNMTRNWLWLSSWTLLT